MQLGKPGNLVELDDAEEHVDADGDDHPDLVEPTSHIITHREQQQQGSATERVPRQPSRIKR
jgi:hypothetical protein